jgi:hypothetical protein
MNTIVDIEFNERTKLEQLKDEYCDFHKSVYGMKARWVYGMNVTESELENMLAVLFKQAEVVWAEEKRQEALKEEKMKEQIRMLIERGAEDVATAVRWLHQAEGTEGDDRYLDYCLGVSYGFTEKLLQAGL